MKNIQIEKYNVHTNVHTKITISVNQKNYSEVKLYIPKVNGKPSVLPNKRWHVYYYFRNPETNKMQKFMSHLEINRLKTIHERKELGKAWIKAISSLLLDGFNPFSELGIENQNTSSINDFNLVDAMKYAYNNKVGTWKAATASDYQIRMNVFLEWSRLNGLDNKKIYDIKDTDIISFLNWIVSPDGRNIGKTSQDNYKRCLSGLFGKLVKDRIIIKNPCLNIDTTKDEPIKNTPFTGKQVIEIRDYLLKNDVQLYNFILHVIYTFLRPREIIRLTANDIHLEQKLLYVETKTERRTIKKLISPLLVFYNSINVNSLPKDVHIFCDTTEFKKWDAIEKTKVDVFGTRFKKIKHILNLGSEYGIYSFRHTAALDLYNSFTKTGLNHREAVLKLMPIIGHRNEKTTEKYLRDVGAMLPKDYGEFYTLKF
ncbi:MAG: integrase [Flavobacterium sp.]|jgi:integrase